jgi:hypothetical protein
MIEESGQSGSAAVDQPVLGQSPSADFLACLPDSSCHRFPASVAGSDVWASAPSGVQFRPAASESLLLAHGRSPAGSRPPALPVQPENPKTAEVCGSFLNSCFELTHEFVPVPVLRVFFLARYIASIGALPAGTKKLCEYSLRVLMLKYCKIHELSGRFTPEYSLGFESESLSSTTTFPRKPQMDGHMLSCYTVVTCVTPIAAVDDRRGVLSARVKGSIVAFSSARGCFPLLQGGVGAVWWHRLCGSRIGQLGIVFNDRETL